MFDDADEHAYKVRAFLNFYDRAYKRGVTVSPDCVNGFEPSMGKD